LPPIAHLLIGAHANTLLAWRDTSRSNIVVPLLRQGIDGAQAQLNMMPLVKRREYPSQTLKWVRSTLDRAGRCIEGIAPNETETIKRVAMEASKAYGVPVSTRKVRECLARYRASRA
jgi:hypothetical protein